MGPAPLLKPNTIESLWPRGMSLASIHGEIDRRLRFGVAYVSALSAM